MPSLNAGMIEEDFLDYLFTKYEREKSDELMALVDARRKDASRANVSNGFDHWIMGLGEAKLSAKMRAKVVADIRTFVESLSGRRHSRPASTSSSGRFGPRFASTSRVLAYASPR